MLSDLDSPSNSVAFSKKDFRPPKPARPTQRKPPNIQSPTEFEQTATPENSSNVDNHEHHSQANELLTPYPYENHKLDASTSRTTNHQQMKGGQDTPGSATSPFTNRRPPINQRVRSQSFTSPVHKLKSLKEAKLLHHFVAILAPWFDVSDPKRHFATVAPCLAIKSPVLMNAILGISALHISYMADYNLIDSVLYHDSEDAVRYHDLCIESMVPLLNDDNQIKDDALLITSMILALHEDLVNGADSVTHIIGTSLFLPSTLLSTRLRRAVFWCHLRQEIYAACSQQRPVSIDLARSPLEVSFEPVDDEIWAQRAIYICGRVVQWAFGEESPIALWRDLNHLVEEWDQWRPGSFDPIFYQDRDPSQGRWFPEACHLTDEHVTGIQFMKIAKVLLTTHDPTIPKIGHRMKAATNAMQEKARDHVRLLCGIGLHNTFVPGCFYAMLAVKMCGHLFEDKDEQRQLLRLMRITEERSSWPRRQAVTMLKEEWGWQAEDGDENDPPTLDALAP
ncbi:uncharacterized protein KY384_004714 [Bacidia gigantensis]|uniref:uncharacterized protein n=1 Tax=Bacidia gigantensis TaxID=2732470 RepID=UPI001D048CBD|nr:uncharacterized protein KY384_004714 [Bacidia gigantensis]KAG8530214.1 hypothetical protein KY384_004714 [Bacidia gigantensis]